MQQPLAEPSSGLSTTSTIYFVIYKFSIKMVVVFIDFELSSLSYLSAICFKHHIIHLLLVKGWISIQILFSYVNVVLTLFFTLVFVKAICIVYNIHRHHLHSDYGLKAVLYNVLRKKFCVDWSFWPYRWWQWQARGIHCSTQRGAQLLGHACRGNESRKTGCWGN